MPAPDKTQTKPPLYNLYSSVGEWAWDINLSTDSKQMPQIPDSRLLAMWEGRMLLGIPPGAPEKMKPMLRDKAQFGPADFVDASLYSAKAQNGFRVGRGISNRFEANDQNQ